MAKVHRIVFWQPTASIHFSAVLRALTDRLEVVLCVVERQIPRRVAQGWPEPEIGDVDLYEIPIIGPIRLFHQLNTDNSLHIFSGTRGYKPIWKVLQLGIRVGAHCALVGETLDWRGWKGIIRYLVSWYDTRFLKDHILFLLAIGHTGKKWYQRVGFPVEKIVEWAYFTELQYDIYPTYQKSDIIRFTFVGRLSREKGIFWLIDSFATLNSKEYEVHLIGDGPLYEEVLRKIPTSITSKFKFYGNIPHHRVLELVASMDYLILPSVGKDGWGAVVNEALQVGTPVIASNYAGASTLLKHPDLGFRVDPNIPESLVGVLNSILNNYEKPSKEKRLRIKMYGQVVSGMSGADYLLEVIRFFTQNGPRIKPNAPWNTWNSIA